LIQNPFKPEFWIRHNIADKRSPACSMIWVEKPARHYRVVCEGVFSSAIKKI
jgi:hypothetical protein